ncbi:MAG: HD domain-containing protein, partial [Desulfobulbaceae bacterium]|nr:HD domain-containing protein [Candidatus Desulfatifera sulfidica]
MASPLRAQREALEELWRQGLSGQALLAEQSRLVDVFLVERFVEATKGLEGQVALLALGGYGRSELFPYSDIDLMILYVSEVSDRIGGVAEAILYPLWDAGLDVGHGVRTVAESLDHAREEFFFQVALLDARFLAGSEDLCQDLLGQFQGAFIEGKREAFVQTMKGFRLDRRQRFGSHSYLLEPHVKEGKGGLRDIQAMLWTARVVFGLGGLDEIALAGILTDEEQEAFDDSWNFLIRVRNRLHYLSGRRNDQLYFEQQEEMAAAFGYQAVEGGLRVESFMRDLYGHLQTISVTTDLFFEHVDEVFGLAGQGSGEGGRVLEKGIELRHGRVHLAVSQADLGRRPYLLMRLFLASSRSGVPVHHRSIRLVVESLGLMSDKLRSSPRLAAPFFEILTEGHDCFAVLESMLETGLLVAYIPELSGVVCLAQHDLYHIYTVDRHSLQAVAELRQVAEEEGRLFRTLRDPRILLLATLLHDIGKGRGGDHSEIGAELVIGAGARLGLSPVECEDVA